MTAFHGSNSPKDCIFVGFWTSLAVREKAQDLELVLSQPDHLHVVQPWANYLTLLASISLLINMHFAVLEGRLIQNINKTVYKTPGAYWAVALSECYLWFGDQAVLSTWPEYLLMDSCGSHGYMVTWSCWEYSHAGIPLLNLFEIRYSAGLFFI